MNMMGLVVAVVVGGWTAAMIFVGWTLAARAGRRARRP